MSSVLVIANPNAGDRGAPKLIEEVALPLLKAAGVEFAFHITDSGQKAGELVREHLVSKAGLILVGGGDGSVHELLNHVYLDAVTGTGTTPKSDFSLSLILLPLGTANAVYASFYPPSPEDANFSHPLLQKDTPSDVALKLRSLLAFIDKKTAPQPLAIALTQTYGPSQEVPNPPVSSTISFVVNSTSLHAAILHSAEKYRATIPGTERFKVAAGENITNWADARVELLPLPGSGTFVYDPAAKALKLSSDEGTINLEGPFFYFLSTINIDRLEPLFVTTPLARKEPPPNGDGLDVVVVRPARRAGYTSDTQEERGAFVPIVMDWFGKVYQGGEHLHAQYPSPTEGGGAGEYITEYFRVGGWKWFPKGGDEFSRLVCVDGTVLSIPKGGYAEARVIPSSTKSHIQLWT